MVMPFLECKLKGARGARPRAADHDGVSEVTEIPASGPHGRPIDTRSFGLVRAAYSVRETLVLLSIGRTSLYEAVKQGALRPTKFGKKTLFCAVDIAAFLVKLRDAA